MAVKHVPQAFTAAYKKHTGVINRCVMNSYEAANRLFTTLLIGALTETCSHYSQYANIITMVTADHLSLSSFSISSIVGIELLNSSGITLLSLYSDMPIGTLIIFTAYCARTLSLVLHIRSPTV